ncbi:MAG: DUF1648 domain-containing protein [Chitinophagaceae bacterium]
MKKIEKQPISTVFDKAIDFSGVVVMVFLWVFAIFSYATLRQIIPIHYNVSGGITKWGDKITLLFFPITATVIFIGLTLLNRHPQYFNTINRNSHNAPLQLKYSMRMLRVLKLTIALAFCLIIAYSHVVVEGVPSPLGPWLLPVTVAVILLPVGYFIIKLLKLH